MRLRRYDIIVQDMNIVKRHIQRWRPAVSFYIHGLIQEVVKEVLLRLYIRIEIHIDRIGPLESRRRDRIIEYKRIATDDRPSLRQRDLMGDITRIQDVHF